MVRMVGPLIVLAVVAIIVYAFSGMARGIAAERRNRRKPGEYEFDSRYNQAYRKLKGVKGPSEDHAAIVGFLDTRSGIEAFLEPKTVAHPLSVVLVAGDGEWKRFELAEDSIIRALAKERGIPVFDAARTGYPQRMREYKRPPRPSDEEPA